MVNILAQAGIGALDSVDAVRLWVGGPSRNPKPPLNYQIVCSLEGMPDYYVTPATILRDGRRTRVEALSGDGDGDIVIARVDVTGRGHGKAQLIRYQLLDRHDPASGISAMARTTGFSLASTALLQARGEMRPDVGTSD